MKTVLLVDDFDFLRNLVRDWLKSCGMDVLEASNSTEAIHIASSHPRTIDLLLTDLEMPGTSGLDCAKAIADMRPGICILCMSGGISVEEWQEYEQKPPGAHFIEKPFGLEELKAVVRTILGE